ncbi:MAG: hypothetical protein ACKOCT_00665 [Alphaproteobacteria bacterium]
MKPSSLSALAGIAALAALGGCAPTRSQQAIDPYAQPGAYGAYPQSAAGSYGQVGGTGTYATTDPGHAATYGGNAAYGSGTYGNGYAPGAAGYANTAQGYAAPGTYGAPNNAYGTYGNGYAAGTAGYPPANGGYGQPVAVPNANGYYARGSGQYPPPSTFDVRQPYYGDGGYHLMGGYNDGESHPLRLVSFAVAPVGYLAEWLVTRPIHRIVAQQDMAPIFSYTPQAGFDYETYEEGLSTGVTFEEPQSLD